MPDSIEQCLARPNRWTLAPAVKIGAICKHKVNLCSEHPTALRRFRCSSRCGLDDRGSAVGWRGEKLSGRDQSRSRLIKYFCCGRVTARIAQNGLNRLSTACGHARQLTLVSVSG